MPASKSYSVKADFTDASGRKWRAGQAFDGSNEKAVKDAIAAGQVEETPAPATPPQE